MIHINVLCNACHTKPGSPLLTTRATVTQNPLVLRKRHSQPEDRVTPNPSQLWTSPTSRRGDGPGWGRYTKPVSDALPYFLAATSAFMRANFSIAASSRNWRSDRRGVLSTKSLTCQYFGSGILKFTWICTRSFVGSPSGR